MSEPVVLPAGEPLGFPRCAKCPYRLTGPPRICVSCASKTLEAIAPRACLVCSQRLEDGNLCRNWLCTDPARRIEHIDAISYLSGPLKDKIHSYKYEGKTGWALIFSRLLLGWLEAHASDDPPDLIVANPTYLAPGQPGPGHVEAIISHAATADYEGRWLWDLHEPAAVIKTQPTSRSAGRTAAAKRTAASELRNALTVPDPDRTRGRSILVFDDVCTTGSQLDAVAACLLDQGLAARVRGLTLARAPWRPRLSP
jgi:predicted amidophosphoribosyltransferase